MPRWIPHAITGTIGIYLCIGALYEVHQSPVGWNTDLRLIANTGLLLIAIAACTWPRKE